MVRVEVHLRDGTRLEETVEAPRGSEQKFASEADVVAKFGKLAGRVLGRRQVDRIVELVLGCEGLADIGMMVHALKRQG
jgi:2-methylcitrate dehydratase PrpD